MNSANAGFLTRDAVDKRQKTHNLFLMVMYRAAREATTTTSQRRASLRAELVRLGGRWLLKHRGRNEMTIEQMRRRAAIAERLVPKPPAGTHTLALNAGGVRADHVSTRLSDPSRHILFLHGGGFIIGSPALYRHFTLRIASAR